MKKILLIGGDPNSINSELIYKSLKKLKKCKEKIYLISNYKLLSAQFKKLKYNIKISKVKNLDQKISNNSIKVIDIKIKSANPFNVKKNRPLAML